MKPASQHPKQEHFRLFAKQLEQSFAKSAVFFVAYLLILTLIAIITTSQETNRYSFVSSWHSIKDIISTSPYYDPRASATASIDILNKGWLAEQNEWILNLWPPGMMVLQSLLMRLFGSHVPIPFALQAIACLQYAILLVYLQGLARRRCRDERLCFLMPLLLFLPEFTRSFLVGPYAILFGDSIALGAYLLGVVLTYTSPGSSFPIVSASAGGFFLGLSAYFRPQFNLFATTGMVLVLAALVLFLAFKSCRRLMSHRGLALVVVAVAACSVVMLPWHLYRLSESGSAAWVSSSDLVYRNSVISAAKLKTSGGSFVLKGGGNLTCSLDPSTCGHINEAKGLFFRTLQHHFPDWAAAKIKLLPRYMFQPYSLKRLGGSVVEWLGYTIIPRSLIILAFTLGIIRIIRQQWQRQFYLEPSDMILIWFIATFVFTTLPIWLLVHFEVRYFFIPFVLMLSYGFLALTTGRTSDLG